MVIIFGSEQLISGEVRESNRPMGKAMIGGHRFGLGGTQNQQSLKQPGRVSFSS